MMQNYQKKHSEFEAKNIETGAKIAEVAKLRQEIAEMRRQLAEKKAEIKPIEKGSEIFIEPAQEGEKDIEKSESATAGQARATQTTTQVSQSADAIKQVKVLCDLAFQKGVDVALKAAQELNNPYVLDEFHDVLVDELYERLIKEKKIERE